MKFAVAGSLESNDCLVTVYESNTKKIKLDSVVYDQFSTQILKVVNEVLNEHKITNVYVDIVDKGALDYTIKARLTTALKRLGEINA